MNVGVPQDAPRAAHYSLQPILNQMPVGHIRQSTADTGDAAFLIDQRTRDNFHRSHGTGSIKKSHFLPTLLVTPANDGIPAIDHFRSLGFANMLHDRLTKALQNGV